MSTSPDARDALREAEARVIRVRAENAELQRRLLRSLPSPLRLIAYVAAAAIGGYLGFELASRAGASEAALRLERFRRTDDEILTPQRESLQRCNTANARTRGLVADCLANLARPTPNAAPKALCHCEPGDPLCSCP